VLACGLFCFAIYTSTFLAVIAGRCILGRPFVQPRRPPVPLQFLCLVILLLKIVFLLFGVGLM
jgi:hypothetical protein